MIFWFTYPVALLFDQSLGIYYMKEPVINSEKYNKSVKL